MLFKWETSSAQWHGFLKPITKILPAGWFFMIKIIEKNGWSKNIRKKINPDVYAFQKCIQKLTFFYDRKNCPKIFKINKYYVIGY